MTAAAEQSRVFYSIAPFSRIWNRPASLPIEIHCLWFSLPQESALWRHSFRRLLSAQEGCCGIIRPSFIHNGFPLPHSYLLLPDIFHQREPCSSCHVILILGLSNGTPHSLRKNQYVSCSTLIIQSKCWQYSHDPLPFGFPLLLHDYSVPGLLAFFCFLPTWWHTKPHDWRLVQYSTNGEK